MRDKLEFTLVFLAGIGLLGVALVLRNWGFHVDENLYIGPDIGRLGSAGLLGDAPFAGKPYLFFAVNYIWITTAGAFCGRLKYISLYWLYLFLHAIAVAYLSFSIRSLNRSKRTALYFGILISPLGILSATQIMMESLMAPLLFIVIGTLLRIEQHGSKRKYLVTLSLAVIAFAWTKQTSFPALAILLIGFRNSLDRRSIRVFLAAIVCGIAVNQLTTLMVAHHYIYYGRIAEAFNKRNLGLKLAALDDYLWTWIFYVSPAGLLMLVLLLARNRAQRTTVYQRRNLMLVALSLVSVFFVLFVQAVNTGYFVRYLYPCIFVGLTALCMFLTERSVALMYIVIISYLVPVSNLYGSMGNQLAWWPRVVTTELYNSSWTVLPGARILAWAMFAGDDIIDNLCLYLPSRNSERPFLVKNLFKKISPNAKFFDEEHVSEFNNCAGGKGYLIRAYQEHPEDCTPECSGRLFSLVSCQIQDIRKDPQGPRGPLTNRVCMP